MTCEDQIQSLSAKIKFSLICEILITWYEDVCEIYSQLIMSSLKDRTDT